VNAWTELNYLAIRPSDVLLWSWRLNFAVHKLIEFLDRLKNFSPKLLYCVVSYLFVIRVQAVLIPIWSHFVIIFLL
jgi:hypothetical protein